MSPTSKGLLQNRASTFKSVDFPDWGGANDQEVRRDFKAVHEPGAHNEEGQDNHIPEIDSNVFTDEPQDKEEEGIGRRDAGTSSHFPHTPRQRHIPQESFLPWQWHENFLLALDGLD